MKLVDRNGLARGKAAKHIPAFTAHERQSVEKILDSGPVYDPHFVKAKHQTSILKGSEENQPNRIYYLGDKSITTHVETNPAYDSIKVNQAADRIQNWKILTLRQLRRDTSGVKEMPNNHSKSKKQHGIHVSVSKGNRNSFSSQKTRLQKGKQDSPGQHEFLRKLSTSGRMIQKIQISMQSKNKEGFFFC